MMLYQFTWQHFLVAAAVLTLVWYGLLFVSRFLKVKAGFGSVNDSVRSAEPLPHQWDRDVDMLADQGLEEHEVMGGSQEPEGLSRVSMDQVSFAPKEPSRKAVGSVQEMLQGTVADFLEELKPVFDYAARYRKGLPVFLEQLQSLLGRYPEIPQSPNWEDIVAHIAELARAQLSFEVSPREIHAFLEQEAD